MRSFEQERISRTEINSKKFKFPIPVVCVAPKTIDDNSCVFIYSGGLWGTNNGSLYLNNDFYNNHWFVTYEKNAHGENKNKPSQFRKTYLNEIKEVIEWAKTNLPNKKIYLLGESFGGAIALIASKKFANDISGAVAWNAPMRPKDSEKNTAKTKFICAIKEIFTLTTNITCTLPAVQKTHEKISQNALFVRAMSLTPRPVQNSKSTIAVWRYMHSSRFFLLRNGKNPNVNFLYIQSGQDALCDFKLFERVAKKSDDQHIYYMPTGFHMLSLEPKESNDLYAKINEFISRR